MRHQINDGQTGRNDRVQVLRAAAIVAVVLIHTCPDGMWRVFARPFLNFAVAMFLSAALFLLMAYRYLKDERFAARSRVLAVLGDCSFGIYLSHIMVTSVSEKLPFYDALPFGVNSAAVLLTCCICVLIGRKLFGNRLNRWIGLK